MTRWSGNLQWSTPGRPGGCPTSASYLPKAAQRPDLAARLGVIVFEGPQGRGFYKGGHDAQSANSFVCLERGRRCVCFSPTMFGLRRASPIWCALCSAKPGFLTIGNMLIGRASPEGLRDLLAERGLLMRRSRNGPPWCQGARGPRGRVPRVEPRSRALFSRSMMQNAPVQPGQPRRDPNSLQRLAATGEQVAGERSSESPGSDLEASKEAFKQARLSRQDNGRERGLACDF